MRKGFTLIELMVVIVIIGILASIGVPMYLKTIEVSKATDAVSLMTMIGNANRMYSLDNPRTPPKYANGTITVTCNTSSCSAPPPTWDKCQLVACNYVAKHDWSGSDYDFYACDGATGGGCCSGTSVACARRKAGASAPYSGWLYRLSAAGVCSAVGTNVPACPKI